MTINEKIRDEKLQSDIKRDAAEISALSSGKVIKVNILLKKKYYHPIDSKLINKLNLLVFPWEKLLKNK